MSLIAWYLLNGDYTNKGLGNYSLVEQSSPSYKDNFSLTTGCLTLSQNIVLSSNWSYVCWFYPIASSGGYILDTVLELSGTDLVVSFNSINITVTDVFTLNTWTHIGITEDDSKYYIYINGVLKACGNLTTSSTTIKTVIPNNGDRRIRDVRFYDELISTKLINEISKGLIIHYKLENERFADCSGLGYDGVIDDGTFEVDNSTPRYVNSLTGTGGVIYTPSCEKSEVSISFWYKNPADIIVYEDANGLLCGLTSSGAPYITALVGLAQRLTGSVPEKEWNHVVGVFRRIAANSYKLLLYINGELDKDASFTEGLEYNGNWEHLREINSDGSTTSSGPVTADVVLNTMAITTDTTNLTVVSDVSAVTSTSGSSNSSSSSTPVDVTLNTLSVTTDTTNLTVVNDLASTAAVTSTTSSDGTVNMAKMNIDGISISDFRYYAAGLTKKDVKLLYETAAISDEKNNFYAYEILTMLDKKIYQTGCVTFDLEEKDSKIKLYQSGLLQVNNFYEL